MGCDIHFHAERKVDGKWELIRSPKNPDDIYWLDEWQQYTSFSFLVGVKNTSGITPLSKPRGLPDDLSPVVFEEFDIWSDGGTHNHSWLSLDELKSVDWSVMVNATDSSDLPTENKIPLSEFASCLYDQVLKLLDLGITEPVRVVFWFDN
jgi:hypothetical protein